MLHVVRRAANAVGSVRKLAKKLGVYRGSLYEWKQVPEEHVEAIEALTETSRDPVTRFEMRPDIYGRPQKKKRAA